MAQPPPGNGTHDDDAGQGPCWELAVGESGEMTATLTGFGITVSVPDPGCLRKKIRDVILRAML